MTFLKTGRTVLAALIVSAACQPKDQPPADQPGDAPVTAENQGWTVNLHGYGPIRAGMTLAEAAQAGGRQFGEPQMGSQECDYFLFADDTIRGRAHFMVVNGQIARVDVNDSSISTAEGARMGDSEQRIMELYSGRVTVQPHKYTDGHYLVVAPGAAVDSGFNLIFETDGQKVTTYRAGRMPEVEYIEGCS
jgi:hypothetical protein